MKEEIYFSIVVLCYKSGRALIPLVEKLHGMLSFFGFNWEIILVGNYFENQNDETPKVIDELQTRLPNTRSVIRPKQGMTGWDLRSGLDIAVGKYIGFIDGDMQIPLETIFSCLLKLEAEKLDLVKTCRVRRDDGLYRRVISSIYNGLFRVLFRMDIRDVNSNPKIMLRDKYLLLNLKSDDWFIDAEMMIKAKDLGFKMSEIPMHFYALSDRSSFVGLFTVSEFLINMLKFKFIKNYRR